MISETDLTCLIAAIYEAGVDFDRWPDALGQVADALGGSSASMVCEGPELADCWGVARGIEPGYDQLYFDHYHSVNPLQERTSMLPAGAIHTDATVMPRSVLARTEFFQDFLVPQRIGGMLNAVVLMGDGRQTIVTVHASRAIEDRQVALYRLITPHLRRAAELNAQLARANITRVASAAVLDRLDQGVLFVDECGRVLFANEAAEAILSAGQGLRRNGGVLHGGSMSESADLHAAIEACAEGAGTSRQGRVVFLSRGGGRPPLSVRIAPAPESPPPWLSGRPVAILCLADPEHATAPPAEELRIRFGLTRAQAALALEILNGDGIQAAADRLSITRATARTHLAQIFEKTGTQRQAELVRLLLGSGLSMRSD